MRQQAELLEVISSSIRDYASYIQEELDNEIMNWIDYDGYNDSDFDNEYDYYQEYSNGEAGDVIYKDHIQPMLRKVISESEYESLDYHDICSLINDIVCVNEFGK